jgi:hypothetical protein
MTRATAILSALLAVAVILLAYYAFSYHALKTMFEDYEYSHALVTGLDEERDLASSKLSLKYHNFLCNGKFDPSSVSPELLRLVASDLRRVLLFNGVNTDYVLAIDKESLEAGRYWHAIALHLDRDGGRQGTARLGVHRPGRSERSTTVANDREGSGGRRRGRRGDDRREAGER